MLGLAGQPVNVQDISMTTTTGERYQRQGKLMSSPRVNDGFRTNAADQVITDIPHVPGTHASLQRHAD